MVLPVVNRHSYAVESPFNVPEETDNISDATESTPAATPVVTGLSAPQQPLRSSLKTQSLKPRTSDSSMTLDVITPRKRVSVVDRDSTVSRKTSGAPRGGTRRVSIGGVSNTSSRERSAPGSPEASELERRDSNLSSASGGGTLRRKNSRVEQVMKRLHSMTDDERQGLEDRYRTYQKEDRARQRVIRERNEADIKQKDTKQAEMRQRGDSSTTRIAHVRQTRRMSMEHNALAREESVRMREADRAMDLRRQRRLQVLIVQAAFGLKVMKLFGVRYLDEGKKLFYKQTQESVWMALASAKICAASRRNLFLKYVIFKRRFRQKVQSAVLIRTFLKQSRAVFERPRQVQKVVRASLRIGKWWRGMYRVIEAQVALYNLLWDKVGGGVTVDGKKCVEHITGDCRYRAIRAAIKDWRKARVTMLRDIEQAAQDVEDGGTPIDRKRMSLIATIKVPRLKWLPTGKEMETVIVNAYHVHCALRKQRADLEVVEADARAEVADLERRGRQQLRIRLEGIANAIEAPEGEGSSVGAEGSNPSSRRTSAMSQGLAPVEPAADKDGSPSAIWDAQTGRRMRVASHVSEPLSSRGSAPTSPRSKRGSAVNLDHPPVPPRRSSLQRKSLTPATTPSQPASLPPVKVGRRSLVADGDGANDKPHPARRKSNASGRATSRQNTPRRRSSVDVAL